MQALEQFLLASPQVAAALKHEMHPLVSTPHTSVQTQVRPFAVLHWPSRVFHPVGSQPSYFLQKVSQSAPAGGGPASGEVVFALHEPTSPEDLSHSSADVQFETERHPGTHAPLKQYEPGWQVWDPQGVVPPVAVPVGAAPPSVPLGVVVEEQASARLAVAKKAKRLRMRFG